MFLLLSPKENVAITVIQYTVGISSMIGSIFVILLIIISGRIKSFRYRIIAFLLLSDFITSMTIVVGSKKNKKYF